MSKLAGTGCIILRRDRWGGGGRRWGWGVGGGGGGGAGGAVIPALAARGFHVYVPDLLGYGRSPKPDVSYSISLQEQTVAQFMQAMNVPWADIGGGAWGV